jgi:ABC-type glycerol-3-phosphate transport system permease component
MTDRKKANDIEANSAPKFNLDMNEVMIRTLRVLLEGFVVSLCAYAIPSAKLNWREVVMLGLVASATFSVLDLFSPSVGQTARAGAGYGISMNMVGAFGASGPTGLMGIPIR